jgi:hypothetical protein
VALGADSCVKNSSGGRAHPSAVETVGRRWRGGGNLCMEADFKFRDFFLVIFGLFTCFLFTLPVSDWLAFPFP